MRIIKLCLAMLALVVFIMNPVLVGIAAAKTVGLPSGHTIELTQAQVDTMKAQPGVFYSTSNPDTLSGQTVVALPGELGGGYVYGTPEALAQAMTNAGATVGATSATVVGATTAAVIAGVTVTGVAVGVAATAASAASSSGATTTPAHP